MVLEQLRNIFGGGNSQEKGSTASSTQRDGIERPVGGHREDEDLEPDDAATREGDGGPKDDAPKGDGANARPGLPAGDNHPLQDDGAKETPPMPAPESNHSDGDNEEEDAQVPAQLDLHFKVARAQLAGVLNLLSKNGATSGRARIFVYDQDPASPEELRTLAALCRLVTNMTVRLDGDPDDDVVKDIQKRERTLNRCNGPWLKDAHDLYPCRQQYANGEIRCTRTRGPCQCQSFRTLRESEKACTGKYDDVETKEQTKSLCNECRGQIWEHGSPVIDDLARNVLRRLTADRSNAAKANAKLDKDARQKEIQWREEQSACWLEVYEFTRGWAGNWSGSLQSYDSRNHIFKYALEKLVLADDLHKHPDLNEMHDELPESKYVRWSVSHAMRRFLKMVLTPGVKYDGFDDFTKNRLWWMLRTYNEQGPQIQRKLHELRDPGTGNLITFHRSRPERMHRIPPPANFCHSERPKQDMNDEPLEDPTQDQDTTQPRLLIPDDDEQRLSFEVALRRERYRARTGSCDMSRAKLYREVFARQRDLPWIRFCRVELSKIVESQRALPDNKPSYADCSETKQRQLDSWCAHYENVYKEVLQELKNKTNATRLVLRRNPDSPCETMQPERAENEDDSSDGGDDLAQIPDPLTWFGRPDQSWEMLRNHAKKPATVVPAAGFASQTGASIPPEDDENPENDELDSNGQTDQQGDTDKAHEPHSSRKKAEKSRVPPEKQAQKQESGKPGPLDHDLDVEDENPLASQTGDLSDLSSQGAISYEKKCLEKFKKGKEVGIEIYDDALAEKTSETGEEDDVDQGSDWEEVDAVELVAQSEIEGGGQTNVGERHENNRAALHPSKGNQQNEKVDSSKQDTSGGASSDAHLTKPQGPLMQEQLNVPEKPSETAPNPGLPLDSQIAGEVENQEMIRNNRPKRHAIETERPAKRRKIVSLEEELARRELSKKAALVFAAGSPDDYDESDSDDDGDDRDKRHLPAIRNHNRPFKKRREAGELEPRNIITYNRGESWRHWVKYAWVDVCVTCHLEQSKNYVEGREACRCIRYGALRQWLCDACDEEACKQVMAKAIKNRENVGRHALFPSEKRVVKPKGRGRRKGQGKGKKKESVIDLTVQEEEQVVRRVVHNLKRRTGIWADRARCLCGHDTVLREDGKDDVGKAIEVDPKTLVKRCTLCLDFVIPKPSQNAITSEVRDDVSDVPKRKRGRPLKSETKCERAKTAPWIHGEKLDGRPFNYHPGTRPLHPSNELAEGIEQGPQDHTPRDEGGPANRTRTRGRGQPNLQMLGKKGTPVLQNQRCFSPTGSNVTWQQRKDGEESAGSPEPDNDPGTTESPIVSPRSALHSPEHRTGTGKFGPDEPFHGFGFRADNEHELRLLLEDQNSRLASRDPTPQMPELYPHLEFSLELENNEVWRPRDRDDPPLWPISPGHVSDAESRSPLGEKDDLEEHVEYDYYPGYDPLHDDFEINWWDDLPKPSTRERGKGKKHIAFKYWKTYLEEQDREAGTEVDNSHPEHDNTGIVDPQLTQPQTNAQVSSDHNTSSRRSPARKGPSPRTNELPKGQRPNAKPPRKSLGLGPRLGRQSPTHRSGSIDPEITAAIAANLEENHNNAKKLQDADQAQGEQMDEDAEKRRKDESFAEDLEAGFRGNQDETNNVGDLDDFDDLSDLFHDANDVDEDVSEVASVEGSQAGAG